MSYAPGTILARKKPFEDDDAFAPYNEIEVIGPSPISANVRAGEWVGQQGDSISIKPTTFGGVVDRPQGELQRDYSVVRIPELGPIQQITVERYVPGPSPEEQFASQEAAPKSRTRRSS